MTRIFAVIAAIAVAAVLGVTTWLVLGRQGDDPFADCRSSKVAGGTANIGGPFTLTRQDGTRVTDQDVITGLTLVYFGYTFCPDVCPFDMARNAEATDLLEQRGIMVTPVMVSIDPERDKPEVMADFLTYMHPRAIGLTGSVEDIDAAKDAYKVYAAKRGEGEDYLVDHSTFTYLMAPKHGMLEFFRQQTTAEEMADSVACFAGKL